MKFNIIIEKDDEGRYVAECPDLPGCLSEGETLEDALENVNEAIIGCQKSRLKMAAKRLKVTSFDRTLDILLDLQATHVCKLPCSISARSWLKVSPGLLRSDSSAQYRLSYSQALGGKHGCIVKIGTQI